MKSFELEKLITDHYERKIVELDEESHQLFEIFINKLDSGTIRAAEKKDGVWKVNTWVKKGILLGFRLGKNSDFSLNDHFQFCDKQTYPLKNLKPLAKNNISLVPGGSSVRRGAYRGNQVTLMPPMYINVGAYVDEGTMVDTWATVGSCAQIGKNCHLSGGVGIGGVLEPLQADPVIVEDGCFIGARSEVVEGVIVEEGAVLAMGCFISSSTKIVDRATGEIHRGRVPAYSVVVPGALPGAVNPEGAPTPSLACAVIVKTVDAQTRSKTSINDLLRD